MEKYKGMSVGDLITTYNKGFFTLDSIQERFLSAADIERYKNSHIYDGMKAGDSLVPLFHYIIKYDKNGNPKKSKAVKCCDASYCNLAKDSIDKEISEMSDVIKRLKQIK